MKNQEPLVSTIYSEEELAEFLKKHPLVLVFFCEEFEENTPEKERFSNSSLKFHDIFFVFFLGKTHEKHGKIMFFRSFEPNSVEFQGNFSDFSEEIEDFLEEHKYPLIISLTPKTRQKVLTAKTSIFFLFLNNDDPEENLEILENFGKFALKSKGKSLFVVYEEELEDELFSLFLKSLSVEKRSMPCVRFSRFPEDDDDEENPELFLYESEDFSVEKLQEFEGKIDKGEIKPKVEKSQKNEEKEEKAGFVKVFYSSAFSRKKHNFFKGAFEEKLRGNRWK